MTTLLRAGAAPELGRRDGDSGLIRLRNAVRAFDDRPAGSALAALVLGIAYACLAALVSFISPFVNAAGTAASFWPAAGVTVVALLLAPYRRWPLLLATIFLVEVAVDRLLVGASLEASAGWGLANSVEPAVAALLVRRRLGRRIDLARREDLLWFLICAVGIGPAAGALIGGATNALAGAGSFSATAGRWFVGDAVGVLVVAPALLTFFDRGSQQVRAGLLLVLFVSLSAFAPASLALPGLPLPYLAMPVVVWLAIVGRTKVAARMTLVVALVIDAATLVGAGPFAEHGGYDGLLAAQLFLGITGVSALLVASLATDLLTRDAVAATLRVQATHDPLTGLANRVQLLDRLDQAARTGRPVSLAFVDLDDFKEVNDSRGHDVGDRLLKMVAERIAGHVRTDDLLARLGGDEFAVVLAGGDPHGVAARVVAALSEPFALDGDLVTVSASVGVATSVDGRDVDDLLRRADVAMYAAKRRGKATHVIYAGDLDVPV